jgi:transcriptional regulator with XRE-family HTH domain
MSIDTAQAWVPSDHFGTRLLLARRELGLTVKEAALRCGLHYATWSTWENGRTPADMAAVAQAVSAGLGVSREWLMWGGTLSEPGNDRYCLAA